MAIRTNSEKARRNVREYIMNSEGHESEYMMGVMEFHSIKRPEVIDFPFVAYMILTDFEWEIHHLPPVYNIQDYFEQWATGLPTHGLFDYYSGNYKLANEILGDILEESEAERWSFSVSRAEHLLTSLIFSELKRGKKEYERNGH